MKMIILNGIAVEYDLQYKNVKRINLRIHRDGGVCVSANRFVPQGHIDSFMIRNTDFILQTLDKFRSMREAGDSMATGKHREYQDGDILYLKGRPHRLRVTAGKKETVEIVGQVILLAQKDTENAERRKRMMDKFLTEKCREEIEEICRKVYPTFEKMGVAWPQIRIRSMVSRWGSCQPSGGVLTFARQLLEAPKPCIEYVVVHEFAHFIHPDHSPKFHAFLSALMPDWKDRRKLLNGKDWIGAAKEECSEDLPS